MNKVILHIGPHKTASTYVQHTLFDNKDALLMSECCYPTLDDEDRNGHWRISKHFEKKQYKLAKENILKYLKLGDAYDNIIISSENFDRLDERDIFALKKILYSYDVKIVYFKRSSKKLIVSNWQEKVKHGLVDSWSSYFFDNIAHPLDSNIINHNKVLDLYSKVFGVHNIIIINYDNVVKNKNDIVDIFFKSINIKHLVHLGNGAEVNKSMKIVDVEIIRLLNIWYLNKNKNNPGANIREKYITFKRDNKDNKNINELTNAIVKQSKSIDFEENFSIEAMENLFINKYKSRIFNNKQSSHNDKYCVSLPADNWFLNEKNLNNIRQLYSEIY